MNLYSSREPFNDDPEPLHLPDSDMRWSAEDLRGMGVWNYKYDPRPQNNPTNPILKDIRKNRPEGVSWAKMLKHYNWVTFAAAHYITEDWVRIIDEGQIEHARKVLTRLAALEKEES